MKGVNNEMKGETNTCPKQGDTLVKQGDMQGAVVGYTPPQIWRYSQSCKKQMKAESVPKQEI